MDTPTPQMRPLHNLSLAALHDRLIEADEATERAKATKAEIAAELEARFRTAIDAGFTQRVKAHGTVSIDAPEAGFKIKGEIEKAVKWDSAALLASIADMGWEQVRRICKITVEIPEKIWTGLEASNPDLAKKLREARTVAYKPKPPQLVREDV